MYMYELIVWNKKGEYKPYCIFNTITEAYKYYIKKYATFGDWLYYLKVAHTFLHKVTDEEIMQSIFRNCFKRAIIRKIKNY